MKSDFWRVRFAYRVTMLGQRSDEGHCTIFKGIDARQQDARIRLARRQRVGDAGLVEQALGGADGQDGLAVAMLVDQELLRLPVAGQQPQPVGSIGQDERIEQYRW